jgi:hypothetical protein
MLLAWLGFRLGEGPIGDDHPGGLMGNDNDKPVAEKPAYRRPLFDLSAPPFLINGDWTIRKQRACSGAARPQLVL